MRFLTSTLMILATAFILVIGCSSNEAQSADNEAEVKEQAEPATEKKVLTGDPYYDSLAQMTHPIRNEENPIVTIHTDYGDMVIELYRDVAPAHADSFVALTEKGFYDGLTFHRIIDGFMIQGGCPQGTGTGGPGYSLPAEFSDLPHVDGTLSMARSQDPNSAGSQFFVCLGRAAFLDNKYTVFGQVLDGYDVLHKIGKVQVKPDARGENSKPVETVYIREVWVSDTDGKPIKKD